MSWRMGPEGEGGWLLYFSAARSYLGLLLLDAPTDSHDALCVDLTRKRKSGAPSSSPSDVRFDLGR